jgi:hypothetical protein
MIVAVVLAIGTFAVIAKLNPISTGAKGRTSGATGTAPVSRVGGKGHFQYKVLP